MTKPNEKVSAHIAELFEHGVETYDRNTKESGNYGGAKVWRIGRWMSGETFKIQIPAIYNLLKTFQGTVFTLNRVDMDEDGNPIVLEGRDGYQRVRNCFMFVLSSTTAFPKRAAKLITDKIANEFPIFQDYIVPLSVYETQLKDMNLIEYDEKDIPRLNFMRIVDGIGDEVQVSLDNVIFFDVPNGPEGGEALWTIPSTRQASAAGMTALPF